MSKLTKVTVMVDLTIRQNDDDETDIRDILDECGYEFRLSPDHEANGAFVEYSDMWDYNNIRVKTTED